MTYDCINGWEDIIGNLVEHNDLLPEQVNDDAAEVATAAISAICAMRVRGNVVAGRHDAAARAMLAALENLSEWADVMGGWESPAWSKAAEAIAVAKAAGITTEGE